ncbi:hypothetical protein ACFPPF_03910 [Xenophilus aerolatus]|nr:hypothetical protein [Xenophilus aerolatus]
MSRVTARWSAGFLLVGGVAVAAAQPAAPAAAAPSAADAKKKTVEVVLTQAKVVKGANGAEQLLDATAVKPGDIIEYRATYTNNTGKAVSGLVANLPLPEGLEYQAKSAKPGAELVKAATKDGVFAAEPLMRKVDGKLERVPYSDYRSLRWTLGQLPANGVTAVSARARVEEVIPPEPKTATPAAQAPPAVTVTPAR